MMRQWAEADMCRESLWAFGYGRVAIAGSLEGVDRMAEHGSMYEQFQFEIDPDAPPTDFDAALARFLLLVVETREEMGRAVGPRDGRPERPSIGQRSGDLPQ
jgi:hypothetical protein